MSSWFGRATPTLMSSNRQIGGPTERPCRVLGRDWAYLQRAAAPPATDVGHATAEPGESTVQRNGARVVLRGVWPRSSPPAGVGGIDRLSEIAPDYHSDMTLVTFSIVWSGDSARRSLRPLGWSPWIGASDRAIDRARRRA
jgi:hypothetical protein